MSVIGADEDITQAAQFWGRRKREKMPKLLSDRLAKMLEKLRLAQAALADACARDLGQGVEEAEEYILECKRALVELAQAKLQRNKRGDDKAVAFFKLAQRVKDAEALQQGGFADADQLARRIVAGEDQDLVGVHDVAAKLAHDLAAMKRNMSIQELAITTYQDVAEKHIVQLQAALEGLAAQVKKHEHKLKTAAGTHKEKVRYNAKLTADGKEISQVLDQYNQLRAHGKLDRPAATLEQIRAAEFPWVDENREGLPACLRRLGVYATLRLCEAHNKVQRLEEEVQLVPKEMRQYLQYCRNRLCQVAERARAISQQLADLAGTDPAAHVLVKATGRYELDDTDAGADQTYLHGSLAKLMESKAYYSALLADGLERFRNVQGNVDIMSGMSRLVVEEYVDPLEEDDMNEENDAVMH
ncbi:hypothetical protein WJX72_003133 [[Myrmecia] bisecta]|uniref:Uncharacterized protein n=1 Tax=[Myrmecia] bisecta TaxID=41462 RepID=A0AAW1QEI7_9CHLO